MVIELSDHDTRLIYAILLKEAREHLVYTSTSEMAEKLYKLATRLQSLSRRSQSDTDTVKSYEFADIPAAESELTREPQC